MSRFCVFLALLALVGCVRQTDTTFATLVYETEPESEVAGGPGELEKLAGVLKRRLASLGNRAITVESVPPNRIKVVVPQSMKAELDRIDRLVQRPGTLEFRILANQHDHKALIERAEKEPGRELRDDQGKLLAWWLPVVPGQESSFDFYREIAKREHEKNGSKSLEILVVKDAFDVTGEYLARVSSGTDQSGRPKIDFVFNTTGGKLFTQLTKQNLPDEVLSFSRKLGLILDNRLYSAPAIRSTIGEQGEIAGNFTRQETEDLARALNMGSLPVKLKKVSLDLPGEPQ